MSLLAFSFAVHCNWNHRTPLTAACWCMLVGSPAELYAQTRVSSRSRTTCKKKVRGCQVNSKSTCNGGSAEHAAMNLHPPFAKEFEQLDKKANCGGGCAPPIATASTCSKSRQGNQILVLRRTRFQVSFRFTASESIDLPKHGPSAHSVDCYLEWRQ
jgi:hypothetical protein